MTQVSDAEFELTPAYIRELVDSEARRRLGISGADMLDLYTQGELDDPGRVADLIALADLLRAPAAA